MGYHPFAVALEHLTFSATLFAQFVHTLSTILFFEIAGVPLILVWLVTAAIATTLRFGFINLRGLGHAIAILRGQYDSAEASAVGQVNHFQALATAISATVGLGNIAGVAIALRLGGPGAMFWMTLASFFGMSLKFVECTLGQTYRQVQDDEIADVRVVGGPMYYLSAGLAEQNLPTLGRWLAAMFALCCVGGALGGAGMFQVSQSYGAIQQVMDVPRWLYGGLLMVFVGWVTLGGASRVGRVAARLVPTMCAVYGAACVWVIATHVGQVPGVVSEIVHQAFIPQAAAGGFLGVMMQGFRRAAFSNEAGVGSSAIAHAATRNPEPVREGLVAMLEPIIDTGIVCNLTALVILLTGVLEDSALADLGGSQLTSAAFGSVIGWFPLVLAGAVLCFAFSTMVSWGYYGERAWAYLFGLQRVLLYRLLFLGAIFVGAIATPAAVVDFSDAMFLAMALFNIAGIYLLSGRVKQDLRSYWVRLRAGDFEGVETAAATTGDAQASTL